MIYVSKCKIIFAQAVRVLVYFQIYLLNLHDIVRLACFVEVSLVWDRKGAELRRTCAGNGGNSSFRTPKRRCYRQTVWVDASFPTPSKEPEALRQILSARSLPTIIPGFSTKWFIA